MARVEHPRIPVWVLLSMTGLSKQTTMSTEKKEVSRIFFCCLHLAPLWNSFRAPNDFICSGKKCYAPHFLKLGRRRKYPCSHCAWCHSPFIQEAGNLSGIFSLGEFDSKIPTSQKNQSSGYRVLLGQIRLHPSHWRWVRVSNDRSCQRSKRRVNKQTPDAVLPWGGRAQVRGGVAICQRALSAGSHSAEIQQLWFTENLLCSENWFQSRSISVANIVVGFVFFSQVKSVFS